MGEHTTENPGQRARRIALAAPAIVKAQLAAMTGLDVSGVPDEMPPTGFRAIETTAPPDYEGEFGRAWRGRLSPNGPPEMSATVASFVCDLPGTLNRWWRHYLVSAIHLRPIPGCPPAVLGAPDRTHELLVLALDPVPPPRPGDWRTWRGATLDTIQRAVARDRAPGNGVQLSYPGFSPARAGGQFRLVDDAGAARLASAVAEALCTGELTPERDDFPGGLGAWRDAVRQMGRQIGVVV